MAAGETARILVADDQRDVLEALRLLIKPLGWQVQMASSVGGVVEAVKHATFDLVLMDLNYSRDTTSGREGLDLLAQLRGLDPTLPTVVMTAWGSVDGAVEAMRRGARDYIEKPWQNDRLITTLRSQVELGRALRRGQRLEQENARLRGSNEAPPLVAHSPAMKPVVELIGRIGPSDANVLVTGEHGTGKEVVARHVHAQSGRRERSLVVVNAGGLSDGVFESELFGHVKGAFTDAKSNRIGCFEMADGGTLFLDEIGNMPMTQQAKLLRVLQTGELRRVGSSQVRTVDVRLVCATNADLQAEVTQGRFREDLLYRINTVEIPIPPLRERAQDIPALATTFLTAYAARYRRPLESFAAAALDALLAHQWPGNVRELQHTVERAVLMARGQTIEAEDLGLRPRAAANGDAGLEAMSLDDAERFLIERALARCDGNVKMAADQLGLSRSALYRRLERHGLTP